LTVVGEEHQQRQPQKSPNHAKHPSPISTHIPLQIHIAAAIPTPPFQNQSTSLRSWVRAIQSNPVLLARLLHSYAVVGVLHQQHYLTVVGEEHNNGSPRSRQIMQSILTLYEVRQLHEFI